MTCISSYLHSSKKNLQYCDVECRWYFGCAMSLSIMTGVNVDCMSIGDDVDDNQVDVGLEMGNGNSLKAANNEQLNSHDQSDSSDVSVDDMFAHYHEGG